MKLLISDVIKHTYPKDAPDVPDGDGIRTGRELYGEPDSDSPSRLADSNVVS